MNDIKVPVPFCSYASCLDDAIEGSLHCAKHTPKPNAPPYKVNDARRDLYRLHNIACTDALQLMRRKNEDYASADDPYQNFRTFGRYGILVRMGDKFSRLRQFEANGKFSVEDEGVRDTVLDIINYAILYLGYK